MSNFKGKPSSKQNLVQIVSFVVERIKYVIGRDQESAHHHFLLFPTMVPKLIFLNFVKIGDCLERLLIELMTVWRKEPCEEKYPYLKKEIHCPFELP